MAGGRAERDACTEVTLNDEVEYNTARLTSESDSKIHLTD